MKKKNSSSPKSTIHTAFSTIHARLAFGGYRRSACDIEKVLISE